MFSKEIRSVHFVGICGTAMAPAAAAMKEKGYTKMMLSKIFQYH
jgi:UDP-N-acetylmuramate-alanine ligase